MIIPVYADVDKAGIDEGTFTIEGKFTISGTISDLPSVVQRDFQNSTVNYFWINDLFFSAMLGIACGENRKMVGNYSAYFKIVV